MLSSARGSYLLVGGGGGHVTRAALTRPTNDACARSDCDACNSYVQVTGPHCVTIMIIPCPPKLASLFESDSELIRDLDRDDGSRRNLVDSSGDGSGLQ